MSLNPTLPDFAAVIFDFDGVVVDSTAVHIQCWEIAHKQMFGVPLSDPGSLVGAGGRHIARKLSSAHQKAHLWEELYQLKTALLQEHEDTLPIVPGLESFLNYLQIQALPYGIGSNARRAFIDKILAQNTHLIFTKIVSVDDVKRPKPHPDVFEKCAVDIGIPYSQRHRILVFEDSPIGITAAVSAGMTPVGLTTQLPRNVIYNAGVQHIFANYLDVLAI